MSSPFSLEGRRVLLTGASSDIGKACAQSIAELGGTLVLSGRNGSILCDVSASLAGAGHVVEPFDLTSTGEEIASWVKDVGARHGPLSGLVHCAGVQQTKPLRAVSEADLEAAISINLRSALFLGKGFAAKGVHTRPASLVFISSIRALVGEPATAVYTATKAALTGLVRVLAVELAPQQITANIVAPSVVLAGMGARLKRALPPQQFATIEAAHPLGIGEAADVGHAVAFLLSGASRWITGTTLVLDGGYSAR
jgi:NAD(P)-dependent dehydrogenase (short-subunit alcohol dehydrogenase family)